MNTMQKGTIALLKSAICQQPCPLPLDFDLEAAYPLLKKHHMDALLYEGAVLGGAPVLLLDECTSALDAVTEQKVLERIRALPGRTTIAVTHRPAAMELCDWQLQVAEGKIRAVKMQ